MFLSAGLEIDVVSQILTMLVRYMIPGSTVFLVLVQLIVNSNAYLILCSANTDILWHL